MLDKLQIRREMLQKRKALTQNYIDYNSEKIVEKVLKLEQYINCDCIYIYMNFDGEVATQDIALNAFKNNKKVAIPKITNGKMDFYYINSSTEVKEGYFGIREPLSDEVAKDDNTLVIMPGVAFDRNKNRIGYGKGFYDEYLRRNKISNTIALAFDFQILEELPYDSYDVRVKTIVSEKEIIL